MGLDYKVIKNSFRTEVGCIPGFRSPVFYSQQNHGQATGGSLMRWSQLLFSFKRNLILNTSNQFPMAYMLDGNVSRDETE